MTDPVLFLGRSEVVKALDPRVVVGLLGEAYIEHSALGLGGESGLGFPVDKGSVVCSSLGVTPRVPAYSLKVEGRFSRGGAAERGVIHLYDRPSGKLLSLIESSHISAVGSALAAALATDLLALTEARSLAVVGTGTQGWMVVRFLMEMRSIEEIRLFDLVRSKSQRMAGRLRRYENLKVVVGDGLTETVAEADIILCATRSASSFLSLDMVKPGAHVTSLGSDEPGKRELTLDLLRHSLFTTDDSGLAATRGALRELTDRRTRAVVELGELLVNPDALPRVEEDVTIYAPVGLPFQDLVTAWAVYEKAVALKLGVVLALDG